ncbi:MAG: choice-of-anchor V domain-containing protein [bacterium]
MKHLLKFLPLLLILLLTGFSGNDLKYPQGSPAGYTGSPSDGKDCTDCHNGTATSVSGWITSDVPADGYTPGVTYNITVTVSGTGSKGFEVSPQATDGTLLGTLIAGTGSKLVGNGKYITQTSSSSANPKTWTFKWQAPIAGTGSVTFYGAFTINKPVTKLSTLVVAEKVNTSIGEIKDFSLLLYPNPVRDFIGLAYRLENQQTVKIDILNMAGSLVGTWIFENQNPGEHVSSIDTRGTIPAGLYFVRLSAGNAFVTKKMIVL